MLSPRCRICSIICVLVADAIPAVATAQPLGKHHYSVEALVAPPAFAAVGTIERFKETVVVPPRSYDASGIWNERGEFDYVLEVNFTDVLKKFEHAGDDGEFETLRTLDRNAGKIEQLQRWVQDQTPGLWLIHPKYRDEQFHRWEFIPFEEDGINNQGQQATSLRPPMFARDLSILTTHEAIMQRLREYAAISQKEQDATKGGVVSIRIPREILGGIESGDFNELLLPFDSKTPELARRLIESPDKFIAEATAVRDRYTLDNLCEAGIQLLGKMRTKESSNFSKIA